MSYKFLVGDPELSLPDTVEILKDERFNYVHYSIENNEIKQLEPPKDRLGHPVHPVFHHTLYR